jgi:hypothetical protein
MSTEMPHDGLPVHGTRGLGWQWRLAGDRGVSIRLPALGPDSAEAAGAWMPLKAGGPAARSRRALHRPWSTGRCRPGRQCEELALHVRLGSGNEPMLL